MAKQVGAMGPSGLRLGVRLRELRQSHGLTLNQLADRLTELGRPIDLSALAKIEKGQRRVDVDDLVALALALDVSPNWLLLPDSASSNRVEITAAYGTSGTEAWLWALRDQPVNLKNSSERTVVVAQEHSVQSNFWFLEKEWPEIYYQALCAEKFVQVDPKISCVYCRSTLEMTMLWLGKATGYEEAFTGNSTSALISWLVSNGAIPDGVASTAKSIYRSGSEAAHSSRIFRLDDALTTIEALFDVLKWFSRASSSNYGELLDREAAFDTSFSSSANLHNVDISQTVESGRLSTKASMTDTLASDSRIFKYPSVDAALTQQMGKPGAEVESNVLFELLLAETGWIDTSTISRDYRIKRSKGPESYFIDYVLWDNTDKPLALVEVKSGKSNLNIMFEQLRTYGREFENRSSRRPFLFCVNGSEVFIWDEISASPRRISGFLTKEELLRRIDLRSNQRSLNDAVVAENLSLRRHQSSIVRAVLTAFDQQGRRKALVSMPTGSGKTLTSVALIDILFRAGWARRVLVLTHRKMLEHQISEILRMHLSDISISTEIREESDACVFVAAPHKFASLVPPDDEAGSSGYGHGFFDLIVIDDIAAVGTRPYQKLIDYFDALVVGFTSSPPDGLDGNIRELFDIRYGDLTASYGFDDAIRDGYLVGPEFVKVQIGPHWDRGSAGQIMSEEAIDAALSVLTNDGMRAEDGRVGKTIIFAQSIRHAEMIARRFRLNYPEMEHDFILPINSTTAYAPEVIDRFRNIDEMPRVAVSSGMLDSGISVREVVNLVFLRQIGSKNIFWTMLGMGSQLAPNKDRFRVFDFGDNTAHYLK
ncbi:DEAD/DEAH box helicase family protein [Nocardia sp. NBC_01327]|uniref:DEAD/DEAH box helicase family protein n=1 Tax=Nocardia sp. NBC_01327 TaxID=2903593 RepID=UPI002E0F4491|nr:DEAD/DEAH box helicase family protein [Nocardia sp. NBC_01327]